MVPLRCDSPIKIGRDETNNLPIKSMLVSRFHAIIEISPVGVTIRDLQSTNGTFVNGEKLETSVTLTTDATLQVGDLNMKVEILPRAIENLRLLEADE